jgi:hypothetical protein
MIKQSKFVVLFLVSMNILSCKAQELIYANYMLFPECEIIRNGEKYRCCDGTEAANLQECYNFEKDDIVALLDGVKPKPRPSSSNCIPLPFQIKNFSKGNNGMTIKYLGNDTNPIAQCTSTELISRFEMIWDKSSQKNINNKSLTRKNITFFVYGIKDKKLNATLNYMVKKQQYTIQAINGQFDISTNKKVK